jgi:hypothetical protein
LVVSGALLTLGFTVLAGGALGDLLRTLGIVGLVASFAKSIDIATGNEDKLAERRSRTFLR